MKESMVYSRMVIIFRCWICGGEAIRGKERCEDSRRRVRVAEGGLFDKMKFVDVVIIAVTCAFQISRSYKPRHANCTSYNCHSLNGPSPTQHASGSCLEPRLRRLRSGCWSLLSSSFCVSGTRTDVCVARECFRRPVRPGGSYQEDGSDRSAARSVRGDERAPLGVRLRHDLPWRWSKCYCGCCHERRAGGVRGCVDDSRGVARGYISGSSGVCCGDGDFYTYSRGTENGG